MENTELSARVEIFDGDEINIESKLLDFLNRANLLDKTNQFITSDIGVTQVSFRIYNLLNKDEYIHTCANEVPLENGDWCYNSNRTYDIYYVLLEDNDLLVIEDSTSINRFSGDPHFIRFILYPNANQFVIRTKNGHREDLPYTTIVNQNERLISRFYFEISYDESKDLNGLPLYEVLPPVGIDYLASNIGGRK